MKTIKTIALAAIAGTMIMACNSNNDPKVDVERPSQAQCDSVSYLVGVWFGNFIKSNGFGENLSKSEIMKGMNDFLKAEGNPNDEDFSKQFKVDPNEINQAFTDYITKENAYKAAVNKAKGEEFLAENKMKDGVVTTDSGLQYKIIEEGNEVKPVASDTVQVNYTGTLIDGTVFDSSEKAGGPVSLELNRVIKGWTEGLQLIGEGGKIQLFIPAELGYGENPAGIIEPNSTLIFDVELVKVGKVKKEEAPAEEPAK